ncbi:hypothetical protein [Aeromonas veronii]|uniref:hypothetical protein n=1 Tax=Aeromonas veronii TaxID=654 RepID=UPI002443C218|nr:hypothetical protein [Aeromonas veronii]
MAEKLSQYLNTKGCCGILFYCLQQALQDVDERTLSVLSSAASAVATAGIQGAYR